MQIDGCEALYRENELPFLNLKLTVKVLYPGDGFRRVGMGIVWREYPAESSDEHLMGLVSFLLDFGKDWIPGPEITEYVVDLLKLCLCLLVVSKRAEPGRCSLCDRRDDSEASKNGEQPLQFVNICLTSISAGSARDERSRSSRSRNGRMATRMTQNATATKSHRRKMVTPFNHRPGRLYFFFAKTSMTVRATTASRIVQPMHSEEAHAADCRRGVCFAELFVAEPPLLRPGSNVGPRRWMAGVRASLAG